MKPLLRKANTLLLVYYAYMVEYRAELLFWMLSGSFPLIMMGLWNQAARSGQFDLDSIQVIRYFLAVFLIRQLTVVWVIWDFEKAVLEGSLSFRLLQPLDPVWHYYTSHLAERFARLPFVLALIGLFFFLYPQAFWLPSVTHLLLFVLAALLAFSLRFVMQYTFSMAAFWIERAVAIEQFWYLFLLFLSGMIAPLEIFPPLLREIVLWTPFPYVIYFPAAILVGLPVQLGRGLLVMLAWGAIFFSLNRWLWRKGLKRYSGMGA